MVVVKYCLVQNTDKTNMLHIWHSMDQSVIDSGYVEIYDVI